jgi:multiple sugar transport system permease protein
MQASNTKTNPFTQYFTGRRGRELRESITAYLMLAPALLLIFVFGIFPVAFAVYVSFHKWLIIRDDFRGMLNYVEAIDNFAYFGGFLLGIGALAGAFLLVRKVYQTAQEKGQRPWLLAIPGALWAGSAITFVRWAFFQLPEFLDIATKMRGQERTRELFLRLINEAFYAETVYPAWQQFSWVFGLAIAASLVALYFYRAPQNVDYQLNFTVAVAGLVVGAALLGYIYNQIELVYNASVESGTDPGIWPQLIMITSGIILLGVAWWLWTSAEKQESSWQFAARIFASILLMVGAVMLIIEIPTIVASGDKDLWDGLKVTVYFSLFTVPVQLSIALFLSVLLFQRMKGSDTFRIIFFLPYVTPAVASATVFRFLFSDRATAPINRLFTRFGMEPQLWLRGSKGIFQMAAEVLHIEGYPASVLPAWLPANLSALIADWMLGPSQALLVVVMLSVWTFVGYNVVIYLAGLGNIPTEMTEAASIDGANRWTVFRHITFPLLSPTTYFLSLISVMGTFKAFNTIWVLREATGPAFSTTRTISVAIFEEFFIKTRYGYASAMAFVLFAIILSLTLINNRIQGSRVFYG